MAINGQGDNHLLNNKRKATQGLKNSAKGTRKRTSRRNIVKKTLQRRKPLLRKRFTQKENEQAELGQTFNKGYNAGFAKGFEDGHHAAYKMRP
jgi:flagellar biosynthesis/type III secretory pathway protein FliH